MYVQSPFPSSLLPFFSFCSGQLLSRRQTHLRFYASFERAPSNHPWVPSLPPHPFPHPFRNDPSLSLQHAVTKITGHEARRERSIWYLNKRTCTLALSHDGTGQVQWASFFGENWAAREGQDPWIFMTRERVWSIRLSLVNMLIRVRLNVHFKIKRIINESRMTRVPSIVIMQMKIVRKMSKSFKFHSLFRSPFAFPKNRTGWNIHQQRQRHPAIFPCQSFLTD